MSPRKCRSQGKSGLKKLTMENIETVWDIKGASEYDAYRAAVGAARSARARDLGASRRKKNSNKNARAGGNDNDEDDDNDDNDEDDDNIVNDEDDDGNVKRRKTTDDVIAVKRLQAVEGDLLKRGAMASMCDNKNITLAADPGHQGTTVQHRLFSHFQKKKQTNKKKQLCF